MGDWNDAGVTTWQRFPMAYGRTGWCASSVSKSRTSCDDGAVIRENRRLDAGCDRGKRLDYLAQAVSPIRVPPGCRDRRRDAASTRPSTPPLRK
ncbi:hypothetical protein GCM10023083_64490 [Streptomyces phyllanthi]